MTTNTYHVRDGVFIQAECYEAKVPQIQGTVIAGPNHYLVRKVGGRVQIVEGDFIIRGEDGQVDAMPAALFHQLFEIDQAEAQVIAKEKKAATAANDVKVAEAAAVEAAALAEADAQNEDDAEAEAAADAVADPVIDEPIAGDEVNIFDPTDDLSAAPEAPADPPPKKIKKKSRRKKKT